MIERVYHPYIKWEDHEFGMYKKECFMDEQRMIKDCELLLRCPEWLWESMQFCSHQWKYSAEHNLTNVNRNRQAWLGQAACCFAHGAPEYLTKLAWNNLTQEQQKKANDVADEVIKDWEEKYSSGYFN
jgi:hypothetical protein